MIILVITFLHNFAFNAGTFYLALYFQAVYGLTPLDAGIQMLPYSLGSSLASMPAAWLIGHLQKKTGDTNGQKWIITMGLFISSVGFGLLTLLDDMTTPALQIILPLTAGIGIGMLFHAPYQVFARALDPATLATGTSAFFLVRFTGATIGLAVAGLVYNETLMRGMPATYWIEASPSIDWSSLQFIEPTSLRSEVLHAVAVAIKVGVYVICYLSLTRFVVDDLGCLHPTSRLSIPDIPVYEAVLDRRCGLQLTRKAVREISMFSLGI